MGSFEKIQGSFERMRGVFLAECRALLIKYTALFKRKIVGQHMSAARPAQPCASYTFWCWLFILHILMLIVCFWNYITVNLRILHIWLLIFYFWACWFSIFLVVDFLFFWNRLTEDTPILINLRTSSTPCYPQCTYFVDFFFFFWTQAQYYGGCTNHSPFAPQQQGPAMRVLYFFFWIFFLSSGTILLMIFKIYINYGESAPSTARVCYEYFTNFFVLKKINSVLWRKLPLWSTCASSAGPCYPYFNNFFVQIFCNFL